MTKANVTAHSRPFLSAGLRNFLPLSLHRCLLRFKEPSDQDASLPPLFEALAGNAAERCCKSLCRYVCQYGEWGDPVNSLGTELPLSSREQSPVGGDLARDAVAVQSTKRKLDAMSEADPLSPKRARLARTDAQRPGDKV